MEGRRMKPKKKRDKDMYVWEKAIEDDKELEYKYQQHEEEDNSS